MRPPYRFGECASFAIARQAGICAGPRADDHGVPSQIENFRGPNCLNFQRLIALASMNTNPYLARGFEPLRIEYDRADLAIEGRIPDEIDGTFYRIGPNPQFPPRGIYNPLNGDGMVHAFQIRRGRVSYRNRWVRTQQWNVDHAAGRAMFGTSGNPADSDPGVAAMRTDGVANTNLVWHGGKLLALEEGHGPIEIHPETLETLGPWNF